MMKFDLRHKAKSALSILLTLCLILSIMSVGIATFSAAESDVAGTGGAGASGSSDNWYISNSIQGTWDSTSAYQLTRSSASDYYRDFYFIQTNTGGMSFRFYSGTDKNKLGCYYGNDYAVPSSTSGTSKDDAGQGVWGWTNTWKFTPSSQLTADNHFYRVRIHLGPALGYTGDWYEYNETRYFSGRTWYTATKLSDMDPTFSSTSFITGTSYNLTSLVGVTSGSNVGTVSYGTYQYYDTTWHDISTPSSWTPTSTSITKLRVTATDGGVKTSGTKNALSARTQTKETTITVKTKLTKPSITVSKNGAANVGDTDTTITIDNYSTITGQGDSGTTFELYKGSSKMTSGYTFDSSTGVFTLDAVTASSAGTYKVQAIAGTTASYVDSDQSDGAELKVYSPSYCLVGNVNRGALKVGDTTYVPTTPDEDKTWWNTWQEGLKIGTATATPGVYTFTFTVNEAPTNERDEVNLGLLLNNGDGTYTQKAFILNGDPYNTSSHGDLKVPDAGIADGDNLYAYNLAASDAGGSLVVKNGQTYTITIDQTKRYNDSSSYPWGKITISATDWFVDTVARKQDYSPTNRTWNETSAAADTIGTAVSVPHHDAKGSFTSSTLTATVTNANYDFIGWYSDKDCETLVVAANSCEQSGSAYTYDMPVDGASATYYALFKQKQPTDVDITVIQGNSDEGEIAIVGGALHGTSAEPYEGNNAAYPGAKVDVLATPYSEGGAESAYELAYWRIINSDTLRDVTSLVMSDKTSASSSFTMPSYPVTVSAVFRERTVVKVTANSSNTSLGTAAYTPGTYYLGASIPITATPIGQGAFVKWQVSGGTLADANAASTTVRATSANVIVKAIFEYKTYQLYYNGKYLPMIRQSNGSYVSSFKVPTSSSKFTIYNKSDNKYANAKADTGYSFEFNSSHLYASIYQSTTANASAWLTTTPTTESQYKTDSSTSGYVLFYPPGSVVSSTTYGNGRIDIVTSNPMGDVAQIYAKDGTIRYATDGNTSGDLHDTGSGGTTCNRGVTKVTKVNDATISDPDSKSYPSTGLTDHLKVYSAPIGSTITIETTVNAAYQTQGYYVDMFVINGWKVKATDEGNGKYTATYTLSDEYDVLNRSSEKTFEITPVYCNSNFEYITFYVDADSVPATWGKTISVCATYNGASKTHFEGTYPGQPLGREGDLYEIKVSKYYYDYNSSTNVWTEHPNYQPAATITAYNYDNVHHYYYVEGDDTLNDGNSNYQTYDYSDFAYLAKIRNVESIMFRCMPESSKTNRSAAVEVSATRPADSSVNTYHLLTDYYGNPIDALGNRISNGSGGYYTADDVKNNASDWEVADAQIKIVSCGNISNDNKGKDDNQDVAYKSWRTKGNWITAWKVFSATGTASTHIAVGTPADFVNTSANREGESPVYGFSYAAGKSATDLEGKITFISYEKELTNDENLSGEKNSGDRIDGQWYYSAMSDFYSDVKVAYTEATDANAVTSTNTTIEVDSNSANNTGYVGTTSGTKATLDGETTHLYTNVTTEAELNATVGTGYMFVGWYIKNGDKYTKIHDNFTDVNTTMLMKKNYTIVAVVKQIPAGSFMLTHSRYTGSKPEAHTGTGKYYISAVVKHSGGSTTEYAETQNYLSIPSLVSTDTIQITLRTVCNGADTFYAWYEEALDSDGKRTGNYYEICDENEDPLGEKEVSYTFYEVKADKFFSSGSLSRNSLDFYSDITHVSKYADITYMYYDRFDINGAGQMASYTAKSIELSSEEIDAGYIPTDATIQKYAPNVIDTIYTDTKWVITDVGNKVQRVASNVTVMATQQEKDCFVQYVPYEDVANEIIGSVDTVPVSEVVGWTNTSVAYNSLIMKDGKMPGSMDYNDYLISAPETITKEGKTYNFVRFDVYRITDRVKDTIGSVIYSSNDSVFAYRVFTDCVIYPVYSSGSVTKELKATIEPAVLNREVFGSNTSLTDRLYADLVVSYLNLSATENTGGKIPDVIKENDPSESGYKIETGMIVDRAKVLKTDDYNYLASCAEQGLEDVTQDILLNYEGGYTDLFTTVTGATAINTLAKAGTGTTSSTYSDGQSNSHTLSKYVNDNSMLTNKNRLDKVLRFNNTESARQYIFAAYSYVVITDTSGNFIAMALSDPQYFNFCYIGSKPTVSAS